MNNDVGWLPIFEYSQQTGKSISTIRRYIRSNRIVSKMIDGKYYLLDEQISPNLNGDYERVLNLEKQVGLLKKQLKAAQEELSELRMLVDLYEKQLKELN